MAEARPPLSAMDDAGLEAALRDFGAAVAYPSAGAANADIATLVRLRIESVARMPSGRRGPLGWIASRPVRRSVLVAVAALLIVGAVAGAVGLGVPGIRILFGGPTPPPSGPASPSASASAGLGTLGQSLGLGTEVPIDEAAGIGGLDLALPPDPAIGPPDAVYVFENRVALVWGDRPGLPADPTTGIGLLLSEFRGDVDEGYYSKVLDSDARVLPVTVRGNPGYWLSGAPHFFFYTNPSGEIVDDTHRVVGDTLIWSDGDVSYRLESELRMDEAIRLAESLR